MRLNKVEFHDKKNGKKSNVLLIESTPPPLFFLSVIVIYLFISDIEYKYWLNYFFRIKCSVTLFYVKYASIILQFLCTVNRLLSPRGAYSFQARLRGEARNRDGGGLFERGGLFNLKRTMVSVLRKEVEYGEEKLKYKKF